MYSHLCIHTAHGSWHTEHTRKQSHNSPVHVSVHFFCFKNGVKFISNLTCPTTPPNTYILDVKPSSSTVRLSLDSRWRVSPVHKGLISSISLTQSIKDPVWVDSGAPEPSHACTQQTAACEAQPDVKHKASTTPLDYYAIDRLTHEGPKREAMGLLYSGRQASQAPKGCFQFYYKWFF